VEAHGDTNVAACSVGDILSGLGFVVFAMNEDLGAGESVCEPPAPRLRGARRSTVWRTHHTPSSCLRELLEQFAHPLGRHADDAFCQMMGGDITVASEPGRGSELVMFGRRETARISVGTRRIGAYRAGMDQRLDTWTAEGVRGG
jgi:hypothetical protein